jgi:plasmid stabilization system protein ParE
MQAATFMQSIEGWLMNLEDGHTQLPRALEFIKQGLEELRELHEHLEPGWTPSEAASEIARLREENRVLHEENEALQVSNEGLLDDLEELSEELEGS